MSGLASNALAASMSSSVSFGGRPPVRPSPRGSGRLVNRVRTRLCAGGSGIRTPGPPQEAPPCRSRSASARGVLVRGPALRPRYALGAVSVSPLM